MGNWQPWASDCLNWRCSCHRCIPDICRTDDNNNGGGDDCDDDDDDDDGDGDGAEMQKAVSMLVLFFLSLLC